MGRSALTQICRRNCRLRESRTGAVGEVVVVRRLLPMHAILQSGIVRFSRVPCISALFALAIVTAAAFLSGMRRVVPN
jgi:hypothetical protein